MYGTHGARTHVNTQMHARVPPPIYSSMPRACVCACMSNACVCPFTNAFVCAHVFIHIYMYIYVCVRICFVLAACVCFCDLFALYLLVVSQCLALDYQELRIVELDLFFLRFLSDESITKVPYCFCVILQSGRCCLTLLHLHSFCVVNRRKLEFVFLFPARFFSISLSGCHDVAAVLHTVWR